MVSLIHRQTFSLHTGAKRSSDSLQHYAYRQERHSCNTFPFEISFQLGIAHSTREVWSSGTNVHIITCSPHDCLPLELGFGFTLPSTGWFHPNTAGAKMGKQIVTINKRAKKMNRGAWCLYFSQPITVLPSYGTDGRGYMLCCQGEVQQQF